VKHHRTTALLAVMLAASVFAPDALSARTQLPVSMSSPSPADSVDLAPLRDLYLASVRDGRAIERGLGEIERIRGHAHPGADTSLEATLAAYQGALVTLRAKHAAWPPQKLRYMRQGLALLDRTVERHPEHAEARYLRLMSCYYLPGLFGRGGSVRADFAALARLLPGVRGQYPPPVYAAIARFVVERGRLPAEQRRVLEDTLATPDA
jgi:hypothetical protein